MKHLIYYFLGIVLFTSCLDSIDVIGGIQMTGHFRKSKVDQSTFNKSVELVKERVKSYHGRNFKIQRNFKYRNFSLRLAGAESSTRYKEILGRKGHFNVYESMPIERLSSLLDTFFTIDSLEYLLDYTTYKSAYSTSNILAQAAVDDTARINGLLKMPMVQDKIPSDVIFLWGKVRGDNKLTLFPALFNARTIRKKSINKCHFLKRSVDYYSIVLRMDELGQDQYTQMVESRPFNDLYFVIDDIIYFIQSYEKQDDYSQIIFGEQFSEDYCRSFMSIVNNGELDFIPIISQVEFIDPL